MNKALTASFVSAAICVSAAVGISASASENRRKMREMNALLAQADVLHFERDGKQYYYDPLNGQEYMIGDHSISQ